MGRPHSGPYESCDPNKDDEQIDFECAVAYSKMCRREKSAAQIAEELGISRATLFRRIEKLMLRLGRPSRSLMTAMEHEHLDALTDHLMRRLDEASNADAARMVSVAAGLSRDRLSLYREPEDRVPEADEEPDVWVDGARAEADGELAEVEQELRAARNGEGA